MGDAAKGSLCLWYMQAQTRFRSEIAIAVHKLPKDSASHARMTLVPTAIKGLLMEYTTDTIRLRQVKGSQCLMWGREAGEGEVDRCFVTLFSEWYTYWEMLINVHCKWQ